MHRLSLLTLSLLAAGAAASASAAQQVTRDIKTLAGGPRSGSPDQITALGNVAIFVATSAHGRELWRTDGSLGGTYMLRDLEPGAEDSNAQELIAVGPYVYFSATSLGRGRRLWRTDGTPTGTILLSASIADPSGLTAFAGRLWFAGNDGVSGVELCSSDGSPAGTGLAVDVAPGAAASTPAHFCVFGGRLFFAATTGSGRELWATDG